MRYLLALAWFLACAHADENSPVLFSRDLAPVLQAKCFACHSDDKAKGGYRTHTYAAVRMPGKSGEAAVIPGNAEESELFKRLVTSDPDDRMPQKDEPLSPAQIDLFRRWIAEGAKLDQGTPESLLGLLIPAPVHPVPPESYPRPLPILAVAFSPGGETLAVSGYHEITLWQTNGTLAGRLSNAPPRIRAIAFHPDGSHLASVGGKPGRAGELSIYNLGAAQFETNLLRTADEMLAVAFSPDGKFLAAGGSDNAIHVFSWESRAKITTIQQHADWVTALDFSADAKHLASSSRDRTARVYEALTGKLETTYVSQNVPLFAVAFTSGEIVASGGKGRSVHLWKVGDGKKNAELGGFTGEIHQLRLAGDHLFSAGGDHLIRQHAIEDRKLVRTYTGHRDAVFAIALDRSGALLASGSYDGEVRLWLTSDGALQKAFIAAPGFPTPSSN